MGGEVAGHRYNTSRKRRESHREAGDGEGNPPEELKVPSKSVLPPGDSLSVMLPIEDPYQSIRGAQDCLSLSHREQFLGGEN